MSAVRYEQNRCRVLTVHVQQCSRTVRVRGTTKGLSPAAIAGDFYAELYSFPYRFLMHRSALNQTFRVIVLLFAISTTAVELHARPPATGRSDSIVYIGTYTGGESEGIYTFHLNAETGELTRVEGVAKSVNPSFVAAHPNGKFLYAVNETSEFNGQPGGGITAFSINPLTYTLTELNSQCTHGADPCHLMIDHSGRCVAVANYTGGSLASYRIARDGTISEARSLIQHIGSSVHPRQKGPHAHSIDVDLDNRFVAVSDLGLDQVVLYHLNPRRGVLSASDHPAVETAPGAGPRHFSFHPNGNYAYGINELNLTVNAYNYSSRLGLLHSFQVVSTLPPEEKPQTGYSTAELYVHPSGKFLYGSNRGHHSIVVYAIDDQTGKLTYVENESTLGETPRSFGIDPTGKYLLALNQSSSTIVVFEINQDTGQLEPTHVKVPCPTPVATAFLPLP